MTENSKSVDELYWHYTDASGLIGILESGTLRASSTLFMNDLREISLGTERVREVFDNLPAEPSERVQRAVKDWLAYTEEAKGRILHTFLFCAAKDKGDGLAMWRGYGHGTVGYAIGLDAQHGFAYKSNVIWPSDPMPTELPWRDVVYSKAEHLALVREAFEYIDSGTNYGDDERSKAMMSSIGALYLDSAAYSIKDEAFVDEKEVRLIIPVGDSSMEHVKYRPSRFGVTPFVEISPEDEVGGKKNDRLPIVQVRVGPTTYPEQAALALRSILDKNGYRGTKVLSSSAPFR